MIAIKINGKSYKIKEISELTTKEFIEVNRIEELDQLKYIAWTTKQEFQLIWKSKISESVIKMIGTMPDVTALPIPREVLGKNIKSYEISTIGQRFMIETHTKYKGFDLLVFICAVALTVSPNINEIESCMERLYKLPFSVTLPAGHFFFHHLTSGRNFVTRFLRNIPLSIRKHILSYRPE